MTRVSVRSIWNAGRVRRWHTHPHLSRTDDFNDGHQGRVARLLLALFPNVARDTLLTGLIHALTHDDGEAGTFDIPSPVAARVLPNVRDELAYQERAARQALWRDVVPHAPDGATAQAVHLCDKLDAWLWMLHHHPALRLRSDWTKDADKIRALAIGLNVIDAVAPLLEFAE